MPPVSATANVIDRALEETIAHLAKGEQSPKARAILIEARRLRSMIASWGAIPPRATARRELYHTALSLFQKAGVSNPPVDPASFPEPTMRPVTSPPASPALPALRKPPAERSEGTVATLDEPDVHVPSSSASKERPPATSTPSVAPSSRRRRRTALAEGIELVHPHALEWRPLPGVDGVSVKVLQRDETSGTFRALVRMAAGSELPRHKHAAHEEMLVVEGSIVHAGVEARAGEYCFAEPGSVHEAIRAPQGATVFLVGSEKDELLPS